MHTLAVGRAEGRVAICVKYVKDNIFVSKLKAYIITFHQSFAGW